MRWKRILPSKSINCHPDRSASLKSLASNLSLFSRMHGFSFRLVIWLNYDGEQVICKKNEFTN